MSDFIPSSFGEKINHFISFSREHENLSIYEIGKTTSSVNYLICGSKNQYWLHKKRYSSGQRAALYARIVQAAGILKVGPKIFIEDYQRGEFLFDYITICEWPSFNEDSMPYYQTMQALKKFHQRITGKVVVPSHVQGKFNPWTGLIKRAVSLWQKEKQLPAHFYTMIVKLKLIFLSVQNWLELNATFCHCNFERQNVLFDGKQVYVVGWKDFGWGHPFFDVVRFSQGLEEGDAIKIFENYLGHPPNDREIAHFYLIHLTLLASVVVTRFGEAYQSRTANLIHKMEAEDLLNAKELPSHTTVALVSEKTKQKCGIFALSEFLRRTDITSGFNLVLLHASGITKDLD